ncbi:cation:proton antiporter regulatory subunit [Dactylosporangium fulvum]|uniref:Cation:proton antiporter regulatory subunit n=1 Tax=Dactylosporangium fulvum TaxID=53359 RepID=A0ABY5VQB8_9ACTN|nr:cation:proton antiporter regulatory subunit [Dactylosporangium fulvum]UWP79004.1 cation:proton antiporter regulatory subunit [Dactylosporangium fulvum]
MDAERTALPGIGLRHEFRTEKGQQAAVVSHVSGRRDLVIYSAEDPDTVIATLSLNTDEANGVAELLGTARIVERLADLQRQVTGLKTVQAPIIAGSPYDGRRLGDTQARTRTGASIVAVIRAGEILASPRPDFVFQPGDLVVVVGTADGTAGVSDILARG